MKQHLLHLCCLLLVPLTTYGQGNLNPPGAPAPTMKTLDQLDTAIAQTNAKVDQSNAKIDQANTKIDALAAQGRVEKSTAATHDNVLTSADSCKSIVIPAGRFVKLESIIVRTAGSTTSAVTFTVRTRIGPG